MRFKFVGCVVLSVEPLRGGDEDIRRHTKGILYKSNCIIRREVLDDIKRKSNIVRARVVRDKNSTISLTVIES